MKQTTSIIIAGALIASSIAFAPPIIRYLEPKVLRNMADGWTQEARDAKSNAAREKRTADFMESMRIHNKVELKPEVLKIKPDPTPAEEAAKIAALEDSMEMQENRREEIQKELVKLHKKQAADLEQQIINNAKKLKDIN